MSDTVDAVRDAPVAGADASAPAGYLNFSSGEAINATTLTLSGGILSGSDNVTIGGASTWTDRSDERRVGEESTTHGSLYLATNNSTALNERAPKITAAATPTAGA